MPPSTPFKHMSLRRYLIAFGSLFDDIVVVRDDAEDDGTGLRLAVPIEYGPKERWMTRLLQDPDFTQGVAQIVPRMSYEMKSVAYDPTRKIVTDNRLVFPGASAHTRARMFVGVPYTLTMSLSILVKYQHDGMQIVEQILPYFTPDYTLAVSPIAEIPTLVDTVPVTLTSVSHADNYEGDFMTRRAIIWDLEFSMRVYFYGPAKSGKPIEQVRINVHDARYQDLLAPITTDVFPQANITATLDPVGQTITETTREVTSTTTVVEHDYPAYPTSASPSGSPSPSSSRSPSPSRSYSSSPSSSVSSSVSPSPSPSHGH